MEDRNYRGVTFKSVIISLLLIPVNVYWIVEQEVVRYTHPTLMAPISNVIFIVFVLTVVSLLLRKLSPRLALNQGELLVCYVMLTAMSCLCSHDMMEILIPTIGHAFWFATPENEWAELFHRYLPESLTIRDNRILTGYYEGDSSFYNMRYVKAWIEPILWWMLFIVVFIFIMLCINTILRKQWTERERLTYPIIQLPLEMTDDKYKLFKSKLLWIGFSLAAIISIVNFFNFLYPSVPEIPIKRRDVNYLFTEKPWNALNPVRVDAYPFVIGIAFLIPLELLFSCWAFYWFYKIEILIGSMMGWRSLPGFPYAREQAFGAYVGLFAFAMWAGRRNFLQIIKTAFMFSKNKEVDDSKEPLPYKAAVWGVIGGIAFLSLFSNRIGMSILIAPLFFIIYYVLSTTIARVRAELGFMVQDMGGMDPPSTLIKWFGTRTLGPSNLTVFALYKFFNRHSRSNAMPHQLEAFKLAERTKINNRRLLLSIMIATVVGGFVTSWILLDKYYRHGAASGHFGPWALGLANSAFSPLQNWLSYPTTTNYTYISFMGVGFLFTIALMIIRSRFLWWTFHPLGYALAPTWGMFNIWSCIFIASVAKWLILKQGGLKAYRKAIPFFLGLALGDYVLGSIWSILSVVLDKPMYEFWP
ncbi:hypothetical protein GF312_19600 [Candidatus Poribacteria bacterium]|nr:hypothetical protein [Candidatus Poribacteria bacterium]